MNRLRVQLTLAFGLVIIVSLLIVGMIVNRQINAEFRRFVVRFPQEEFVTLLTRYYGRNGSWQGIERFFSNRSDFRGFPGGPGPGPGFGMPVEETPFILADEHGHIIYDGTERERAEKDEPEKRHHAKLGWFEKQDATTLTWQGQKIGYFLVKTPPNIQLPPVAQNFLSRFNRVLLFAGIVTGLLGMFLGSLMARRISAPLGQLEAAAHHLSEGQLDQRVTVAGTTEIASVGHAFNNMADSLQQARHAQQHMIADIAHELRTPLSVIQGNLQAILEDVYPLEKTEIATIYDETIILNRLVKDLHELARAEAGRLNLNIQTVDLKPLIQRSAAMFGELTTDKGITLKVSIPETLPPVNADPDRVQQVMNNLLSNALRHTPACGNIDIQVEPVPQNDNGAFNRISVIDSGSGIPSEYLPQVFTRFWRADTSRSRDQGGSGLGLAIARQLVEAQGGTIDVESEEGKGSHFWFTLPICDGTYDQSV
jgi:two-component system OmpR family sensor kinase/two-component system sensor histidine kinase BaeS